MNVMALSTALGGAFSAERLAYAGEMTLLGMLMIFAVLGLLWGVLVLFKIFFAGKEPKKKAEPKETKQPKAEVKVATPIAPATAPTEDLSLIAVLTTAVAAYREAEGESGEFRVVSFRRTSGSGAWNAKK